MKNNTEKKAELTFPCKWEFRMIVMADQAPAAAAAVDLIFAPFPDAELSAGELSSSGKYIPFRIVTEVDSKAEVESLCAELSTVPGFKLML